LSLPVQDLMTVSPDFATLYSYNANVSISRELGRNFVASASYLHTKGTHLPVYRNINLVPSGTFGLDNGCVRRGRCRGGSADRESGDRFQAGHPDHGFRAALFRPCPDGG
jgi:hypothetical protein